MKNLNAFAEKCMAKLDDLHIEYGHILSVDVNCRAKKRWGQAKTVAPWAYSININERLLQDDAPDKALEETLLHEMLHTCEGCMNHGKKWAELAEMVNRAYGYNIKRTNSAEEKGVEYEVQENPRNYRFVCQKCGGEITRQRASKFVKNYQRYICGQCGGRFKRVM